MSEPIFERLAGDAEHAWHDITSHLRHHHDLPSAPADTTSPGATMSIATDLKADLTDGITYVKGWAERLEQNAPALIADAQKAEGSLIWKAVGNFGSMPAAIETMIAGWIDDLARTVGTVTATAAPAPAADGQPAAATDAVVDASAGQDVPVTSAS